MVAPSERKMSATQLLLLRLDVTKEILNSSSFQVLQGLLLR